MTDPLSKPIRSLPNTKWSCHGCGKCCHGHVLGPLEPEFLEGMANRNIEDAWKPAQSQPWFKEETLPNGLNGQFLSHIDGHCIFLREDNLCAIHALYGAEAKPGFCREFPFRFTVYPDEIRATVRPQCVTLMDSFQDGPSIEPDLEEAYQLPRITPRPSVNSRTIEILPGRGVDFDVWKDLEPALVERISHEEGGPIGLAACLRAQLENCASLENSQSQPEQFKAAYSAILQYLTALMGMTDLAPEGGMDSTKVAFAQKATEALKRVESNLENGFPTWPEDAMKFANLLFRQNLFSGEFLEFGGVPSGIGMLVFNTMTAGILATENGRVNSDRLNHELGFWLRFVHIGLIQKALIRTTPALNDLFIHAYP